MAAIEQRSEAPATTRPLKRLEVRKVPFEFGDDTPFQWNPANPMFGDS